MKRNIFFTFSLIIIIFSIILSCASSNSAVSLGVNLQNYQYAYVLADIQRTPFILDLEKRVFEGLLNSRLEMIYIDQIDDLSETQKDSLLRVLISYSDGTTSVGNVVGNSVYVGAISSTEGYGTLYLSFQDRRGNIVASCSGLGLTVDADLRMALKEALKLFPK
jgi:hypothetical protein